MSDLLYAALDFPAVLFGFALLVVVACWLFVLVGGVGIDALDGGEGIGATSSGGGAAGALAVFGLRGTPVAVALSLLVSIAWFLSLVSTVLIDGTLLRAVALPLVLIASWAAVRVLVRPLRRLAAREEGISHRDFVGLMCVVRTGHVSSRFGQAEVTAPDGSTALVQVRTVPAAPADPAPTPPGPTAGSRALIFDYDDEGGFFLVAPYDDGLGPDRGPESDPVPPLR